MTPHLIAAVLVSKKYRRSHIPWLDFAPKSIRPQTTLILIPTYGFSGSRTRAIGRTYGQPIARARLPPSADSAPLPFPINFNSIKAHHPNFLGKTVAIGLLQLPLQLLYRSGPLGHAKPPHLYI